MPDIGYWLAQKYALLKQEADAGTTNASSGATQANANALVAGTTAALNKTQNNLLPAESAATIGLQGAQAGLYRTQAAVLPAMSAAQIGGINADIGLTKANTQGVLAMRATPQPVLPGALRDVMGARGAQLPSLYNYSGYQLPGDNPTLSPYSAPSRWMP